MQTDQIERRFSVRDIALWSGDGAGESERTINLNPTFSEIVALAHPASTLVIGDPNIADVTAGPASKIVITPKSVGATNLIALDQEGSEILRATLNVGAENIVEVRFPMPGAGPSSSAIRKYLCRPACNLLTQTEPELSSGATATNAAGSTPASPPPRPGAALYSSAPSESARPWPLPRQRTPA